MMVWQILSAVALDFLIRDPEVSWHPVRLAGKFIQGSESFLRRLSLDGKVGGVLLVAMTIGFCGLPVAILLMISIPDMLKFLSGVIIIYFSIALGSLLKSGRDIQSSLSAGNISGARQGVSHICGREVDRLDDAKLTCAAVESLAENSVDGFTAPLFYAALFGPAGAWIYRIANTLDSMVGYKNEKYIRFGWAAARLDDLLNFIPARLTALLMSLAAPAVNGNVFAALRTMWKFSGLHPSPNAGWPESAAAGALGLRLGGPAFYFGMEVDKPFLGSNPRRAGPDDIRLARRLVLMTCAAFTACIGLAMFLAGR